MTEFKNKLESLSKVKKEVWLRLAALLMAFVALGFAFYVSPTAPYRDVIVGICFAVAVVAAVVAFWKNNPFNEDAEKANELMHDLKNTNKYNITDVLEALTSVEVGVWVRLILLVVTLLNLGLSAYGKPLIKIDNRELYTVVSYIAAFAVGLLNYFKENSITKAAQLATAYRKKQGFADEESMLDFEEKFDSEYGIDDTVKLIEQLMPESDNKEKLSDALFTFEAWVKANPDKVKALEERLHESVQSFIERVKTKINE